MLIKAVIDDGRNVIATNLESIRVAIELDVKELVEDRNVFHLFTSLEAWFDVLPDGFPRHCEPRKDQAENIGGFSFTEELDLSRHYVKKALKEICAQYGSEEEFNQAEDKFKGKLYCSVYCESDKHRTYYYRNHALFSELKRIWLEGLDSAVDAEKVVFSFVI
ncbi:MAG TPA: hypothetical protein VGC76_14105 [Pyrinomonadaceae bacterium]|jgi:hypothetical protein